MKKYTKFQTEELQMSQEDLDSIERQIQRLKNRRATVLAKDASMERRRRTRQNIIIGAWIQEHQPDMIEKIKSALTRDQDRAVFRSSSLAATIATVDIPLPLTNE
jgi:hypothetical protein